VTGPRAVAKRRWPGTLIITAVLTLTCIALSGPTAADAAPTLQEVGHDDQGPAA